MKRIKYILFVLFFLAVTIADAQRFTSRKRYWSGGVSLNGMNYFGDITPKDNITSFDISFTRPQLGFFATRRLTPRFSVRAALSYGALNGDDFDSNNGGNTEFDTEDQRFRGYRNQHFRNRIAELSVTGIFDLIQNRGFYYKRPDKPIPYIFAGIAVSTNNPQAQTPSGGFRGADGSILSTGIPYTSSTWSEDVDENVWVNLKDYDVEAQKIPGMVISIPLGLGVRYKLTDKLDIAFEAGFRWAFTDQLDGVSGRYQEFEKNADGKYPLAYFLSDRSLAYGSARSGGDDRAAIIQNLKDYYASNNGDANTYSQPSSAGWDGDYNPYTNDTSNPLYDSNNVGFPGERRGNDGSDLEIYDDKKPGIFSGANDIYMVYGIHLSYIFAVQVKCPKFR